MKAAILTAGCRLNQSESDALRARLNAQGVVVVDDPADAEVCYVNTCTVTAAADRSSMQLIHRVRRLQSRPRVVVMGCMVSRDEERVRSIPGVDEAWTVERKRVELAGFGPLPVRSRAFLKVQDGCDRSCAYCVVTTLRGMPQSQGVDEVVRQFARLLEAGFREVVLTGLNLGLYRSAGIDLAGLVRRLLASRGRFRVRLGSLEPDTVTPALLDCLADNRVCAHVHLPLQSGDDSTLRRMGRRYDTREFRATVEAVVRARPDVNLGIDVVTGLPGEDGDSFQATVRFVDSLPLGYLHVFSFSPRPGTRAGEMDRQVSTRERKERTHQLRHLSALKHRHYRGRFVGTVRPSIVESAATALTDNYLRLRLHSEPPVAARESCDMVIGESDDELFGIPSRGPAAVVRGECGAAPVVAGGVLKEAL